MLRHPFVGKNIILSEKPSREIWDLLSLNIVKKHLDSTSGGYKFSKRKISSMQTLLSQSREMFKAGNEVSLLSAPLLYFYSYSLLSKVFIIKMHRKNIEALQNGHGLKFHIDQKIPISKESVSVEILNNGTFAELLRALKRETKIENYRNKNISLSLLLRHDIDIFDFLEISAISYPLHGYEYNREETGKYLLELRLAGHRDRSRELLKSIIQQHPEFELEGFVYNSNYLLGERG